MPEFKNRPNPCVTVIPQPNQSSSTPISELGRLAQAQTVYISRSMAVVAIPIFVCANTPYVPLQKRLEKPGDEESGRWGLPCGYLDWDEDCFQAMARECWEEIGLDVDAYPLLAGSITDPYTVNGDPESDLRQNVTMRYRWACQVAELPDLIANPAECSDAMWYPLMAIQENHPLTIAFNHQELMLEACKWFYKGATA